VSKAIERAQNTVEQRNAEIRKNVLKYDEVMNEQRKVIYRRRDQILDGLDLKDEAMKYLADAVDVTIDTYCVADVQDEWDIEGLVNELPSFYPTTLTLDDLNEFHSTDQIYDKVMAEAAEYYERREEEFGPELMREIERQVMLRIIDQRWREHLYEMDYLQEGINLRAMGQKDPLVEWQREGYEMFGQLMHGIATDFVRYVMHVQVVQPQEEASAVSNVSYSAPDESDAGGGIHSGPPVDGDGEMATEPEPPAMQPVVKSEWDKTPRNAPCPCGSGKKYKLCHGRP
jgi:preprotein translocase subunit SecA